MQALVTGGAGFIGRYVAAALVRSGAAVRVLDAAPPAVGIWPDAITAEIEAVVGDIRDTEAVIRAMAGVDLVVHLAAEVSVARSVADPVGCYAANVTGTLDVLTAARDVGCSRVVFASSAAVYGNDPTLPKRETLPPQPVSPYASSKLAGEDLCAVFRRSYGLTAVPLRFFNVYGPGQNPNGDYAAAVPRVIQMLRAGDPVTVFGDGEQTRDFVHVEDVARAVLAALAAPDANGPYNVASGKSVTLLRLIEAAGAALGRTPEIVFGPERPGDVRHSSADIAAIRDAIGWAPSISLEDGLATLVTDA